MASVPPPGFDQAPTPRSPIQESYSRSADDARPARRRFLRRGRKMATQASQPHTWPAGWYDVQDRANTRGYWDGEKWTGDYAPANQGAMNPPTTTTASRDIIKIALGVVLGFTVLAGGCAALVGAGAHQAAQDLERTNVAPTINNLTRTPGKTLPAAAAKVIVVERAVYDHGYAVVLKNTSTSAEAQDTDVVINAVDKTGTVIASASTTVNLIPAGGKFIVADGLDIERGAAVKELQVDTKVGLSAPAVDQLPKVSHVRLTRDDIGMVSVKAELTNTLAKPLSGFAKAYAVIRDADGRIIDGDYTFPHDDLAPGAKTALSFDMLSDVRGAASADVTVENEVAN